VEKEKILGLRCGRRKEENPLYHLLKGDGGKKKSHFMPVRKRGYRLLPLTGKGKKVRRGGR